MAANRRDFLKSTLFGAAGMTAFGSRNAAGEEPLPEKNPFSADPVALRKVTETVVCSRIGLGTGVHGSQRTSNMTRRDRNEALDIFRYAYDRGIRLFDLADLYGTHEICREALEGKPRDSYAIFSKLWGHPGALPEEDRPDAETVVHRFLKELKTDYIDLVQIHCMQKPNWQDQFGRYFEGLERLKKKGDIRAHGVTCHGLEAARTAAVEPWVDAIHLRMNTANARMDGSLEENVAAARLARRNGKGIIVMKVLGEGAIQDVEGRKKSTAFITNLDATDVMVVGLETRDQIDEFLANVESALKDEEKRLSAVKKTA